MPDDLRGLDRSGSLRTGPDEGPLQPVAVPVGTRRRWRSLDQGVVVLVVLVTFVGVALAKPWESDERPVAAVPTVAPTPTPLASPPPSEAPEPPRRPVRGAHDHRALGEAVRVLRSRYGWGVRALVDEGPREEGRDGGDARTRLREVWLPAPTGTNVRWSWSSWGGVPAVTDVLVLPTGGDDVAALGVTSPPGSPLLDVRVWRMTGGETRLATRRLGGVPASAILLLPPGPYPTPHRWEPDVYRLDVLTGRDVRRITVVVRGTPQPRPPAPVAPSFSTDAVLAAIDDMRPGLVVVRSSSDPARSRPVAERRAAQPGPSLDEAAAWLALAGRGEGVPVHQFVGPGLGPAVVALGVRLPASARVVGARLTQYGTDEPPRDATAIAGRGQVGGPAVLFEAGRGGFAPGAYRIDLRLSDRGVPRDGSHHLELRAEGATPIAPPLLRALRRHEPFAGEWSILGGVERRRVLRPLDERPGPDALDPTCEGGVMVPENNRAVGVGFPAGAAADGIEVSRLFVGGRHVPLGATIAAGTIDGLAVVAPREAGSWPWGYYAVTIRRGERTRVVPFCVGQPTDDGLRVAAATADLDAYFFVLGHAFFDP